MIFIALRTRRDHKMLTEQPTTSQFETATKRRNEQMDKRQKPTMFELISVKIQLIDFMFDAVAWTYSFGRIVQARFCLLDAEFFAN